MGLADSCQRAAGLYWFWTRLHCVNSLVHFFFYCSPWRGSRNWGKHVYLITALKCGLVNRRSISYKKQPLHLQGGGGSSVNFCSWLVYISTKAQTKTCKVLNDPVTLKQTPIFKNLSRLFVLKGLFSCDKTLDYLLPDKRRFTLPLKLTWYLFEGQKLN